MLQETPAGLDETIPSPAAPPVIVRVATFVCGLKLIMTKASRVIGMMHASTFSGEGGQFPLTILKVAPVAGAMWRVTMAVDLYPCSHLPLDAPPGAMVQLIPPRSEVMTPPS
jgi:hypothetical protein